MSTTEIPPSPIQPLYCQTILFKEVNNSTVRIWDVIILVPNAVFLLFLLAGIYHGLDRLRQTRSYMFLTFYGLVWVVVTIGVVRAVVSMAINEGNAADKILWVLLRFFLLATELSVLVFGVFMGYLDSRKSITRVLVISIVISLAYSTTQAVLEFINPDPNFHTDTKDYDIFGHGGMLFWFISSVFFTIVYVAIVALPVFSRFNLLPENMILPTKNSFYIYATILAVMNFTQAVGSMLLYSKVETGMCVVDATSCFYFTCFAPLLYVTFLREFFKKSIMGGISLYKSQHDEPEDHIEEEQDDDDLSLPYQTNTSGKTDITSASYDSTHFNSTTPELHDPSPNPLYNGSVNVIGHDFASGQHEIS